VYIAFNRAIDIATINHNKVNGLMVSRYIKEVQKVKQYEQLKGLFTHTLVIELFVILLAIKLAIALGMFCLSTNSTIIKLISSKISMCVVILVGCLFY
jgi:hypothetical protein